MSEQENNQRVTQYPSPGAKLADALSKAQLEFKAPVKNRNVDFTHNGVRTKYSYADLADVIEAVKQPLGKNGLAIIHQLEYDGQYYGLKTSLVHSSGEFVDTWYPLPDPSTNAVKPQAFGSALTYARRYSLSSLVGIASEDDDDGQSAEPSNTQKKPEEKKAAQPKNFANDLKKGVPPKDGLYPREQMNKDAGQIKTEDIVQPQPDYENQDQSKPENKKGPGDYVIAMGSKKFDGKKISQIGEADLKEIRAWIEGQLQKVPPPKNIALLFDLKTMINLFFESVGVK